MQPIQFLNSDDKNLKFKLMYLYKSSQSIHTIQNRFDVYL